MRKPAVLLCVAFSALMIAVGAFAQAPVDTTSPRIAINQEATDTATRLELLQHELYAQQQEVWFLTLLRQYDDRMLIRRTLFPSGHELVPAYIFSPKPLDRGRSYPGLVVVHGGFHGRLEWRFFDLIDHAVRAGYVVIFPEYRGSAGYGDVHYQNGYGATDVADVLASVDYLVKSTPQVDAKRIGIYGHSRHGRQSRADGAAQRATDRCIEGAQQDVRSEDLRSGARRSRVPVRRYRRAPRPVLAHLRVPREVSETVTTRAL